MSTHDSAVPRRHLHSRRIAIEVFARDDGRYDIEAHLTDVLDRDAALPSGLRRAGEAMHDMQVHLTVDDEFNVVAASARSDAVPYRGYCESITPDYGSLVGLNLMRRFRQGIAERMGGTNGCTHLNELAAILPTAAVQGFAGRVNRDADAQPFQIDRCHAMDARGEAVRLYYPLWHQRDVPEAS